MAEDGRRAEEDALRPYGTELMSAYTSGHYTG